MDVLPLLKQELEHAYSMKTGGQKLDVDTFLNPERRIKRETQESFRSSFLSYLRWDIEQCSIGKMDSAYKFCQDIIRDLRDQLRLAIDFRGISNESYHHFQSYWNPKFLKICVGPPHIRLMQLEALIEKDICTIDFALNPYIERIANGFVLTCNYEHDYTKTEVDYIVKGCSPSMNLCEIKNTLTENLLKRFKPFKIGETAYRGLEINQSYELVEVDGKVCNNIHAFGIPTEGSKYFTLVLGRPSIESTFLLDGNALSNILLDKIQ